jgi:uncharacterized protein YlzI (FlbEa/FlbD family)
MTFLKFTEYTGEPLLINRTTIESIETEDEHSKITTKKGREYSVKQSVEEIYKRLQFLDKNKDAE